MKIVCSRGLLAVAGACGLILVSINMFAQEAPKHAPIGPPASAARYSPLVPNGALPSPASPVPPNPETTIIHNYEGIDFNGSNCGCLPPDTNAAVGNGYLAEVVNVQFRVFDPVTGAVLLDEPLATTFGAAGGTGGDPYIVYDDIVNRWYISAFDSTDTGLFLAISNDSTPVDGFKTYDLTNVGGFPDYNKMGYNHDAIVISYNNFGTGNGDAEIIAIDKAAILTGTLKTYHSVPTFQFRAMPPARMHGSVAGDPMWFVSTDGTDAGGNTIRVTRMDNVLTNSPTFTYTHLTVTRYQNATTADQPGGAGTVTSFPNTTTAEVELRKGHLVTAMASGRAKDGFVYPKGLFYKINVAVTPPALLQQGLIDPGHGVGVQHVSIDEDAKRHLGLSWVESSINEYPSMWVGAPGALTRVDAAPGGGFMSYSFRLGDYSSTVVDSDGVTFWSANEYIGNDGGSDIWRTRLVGFHH